MPDTPASSMQAGPHAQLASMVGEWQGTARSWFEPGQLGDESPIRGTIRLVLGGTFLVHEYECTMGSQPMMGLAIIGNWLDGNQWQTAWVNNFHNGTRIMYSVGESGASGDMPDVLGHYPAPPGPDWGWRTAFEMRWADHLVITHYNVTPEGEESVGVEFDYRRG